MTHLISIDLLPTIGTVVDLGATPCKWSHNNLEFEDAPYEFYEYIETVLGYDASNDNSADKVFSEMFFTILNQEILSKGGLGDDMQFTLVMPEFFHLAFNINIFVDNN